MIYPLKKYVVKSSWKKSCQLSTYSASMATNNSSSSDNYTDIQEIINITNKEYCIRQHIHTYTCRTTRLTNKSAIICLGMNLRRIMLISSSKQVMNSQYMLMDVTADTTSWSLIIYILSTSLAAETSTTWSERERNAGGKKIDRVRTGQLLNSMTRFTKFSILRERVCVQTQPFVSTDHLLGATEACSDSERSSMLSLFACWTRQIKRTDRLIKTHMRGFQQSRFVFKPSCHWTRTGGGEDVKWTINPPLAPHPTPTISKLHKILSALWVWAGEDMKKS